MNKELQSIKDGCRENLSPYTVRAFSLIPKISGARILDAGCGTGVPTLELARLSDGTIHAVDSDAESCAFLKEKIKGRGYEDRITVVNATLDSPELPKNYFDIVWAEGLLNVIGFEKGISLVDELLINGGYFIIHDDTSDDKKKKTIWEKHGYALFGSFLLEENAWPDYFDCLIRSINRHLIDHRGGPDNRKSLEAELTETLTHLKQPENLRSIFYILQKRGAS